MGICSICGKISGTGEDHLDCSEKKRIELEDAESRERLPEKLGVMNNPGDLDCQIRAIIEHMTGQKKD